jgi:hypothetical protein
MKNSFQAVSVRITKFKKNNTVRLEMHYLCQAFRINASHFFAKFGVKHEKVPISGFGVALFLC